MGYVVAATTPTYKGFDTFLGYYRACNNDLFYHSTSPCEEVCALLASQHCCIESIMMPRREYEASNEAPNTQTSPADV